MLLNENYKSYCHWYADKEDQPHEFRPDMKAAFITRSPEQIMKAAHCLRYNSCEHPGWQGSPTDKLIKQIIAHATNELPGYKAAKWHIE